MKEIYKCDGVSSRQHNEPCGNQVVWYYHLHVFLRYKGDNLYKTDREVSKPEERMEYAIKLLLNSFGEGDGFGVYQLIEDVIRKYEGNEVIPHLRIALQSDFRSVRYWTVQIVSYFPSTEILEPLIGLLSEDDFDIKYDTLTALGQFNSVEVLVIIKDYMEKETDLELIGHAQEVIDDIES